MAPQREARRLAAIFVADMVGYSRLVEADERGTIARQKSHRQELIDPEIAAHNGRIVKTTGDGLLVEFASVVDATECAVTIQRAMAKREAEVSDERRIQYRFGINLGDIVIDGDDILGAGVNVAARLEGLAEPGGVCISDVVHQSVDGKLNLAYEDLGEQKVKNITKPVRAYRIRLGEVSDVAPTRAEPALEPPDRPSIAVLPFDNMSGDPEQEYLADGLAEDIITALSKISEMFVIARNSTFSYKGTSPDIRKVARELGVRTVLEGSVRRSGQRVRITAQLIDAATGGHLWAERYDRVVEDIFDLQDEITGEIVTALQVRLTEGEQVRLRRRQTDNLAAWDLYVRARALLVNFLREDNVMARELILRAIELDPQYAGAWAVLAWTHLADSRLGWGSSSATSLERGAEATLKGLELDESEADAHAILGAIRALQRRYEEADEAHRRAIDLAPSAADHQVFYAITMNLTGRADEALALIRNAMRLCPFYPDFYLGVLGQTYRLLGRFDEAIAADKKRLARNPNNAFSDLRMAASYAELGRGEEARFHIREALRKNPSYTLAKVSDTDPYRDEAVMEQYLDLLRSAGLPE